MSELFESDWIRVIADDGFVRVTRTATPAPPNDEGARLYDAVTAALGKARARRVLVDLRGSPPGRNDPEFERSTEAFRRSLAAYERVAILVRTAVGKLQLTRLSRESGRAAPVFLDEAEALAYLRAS
jgi:hypothetical protein